MSRWGLVPLRRVARVVNGGTPGPDEDNWAGLVPWATPIDLARYDGGTVGATDRMLTFKGLSQSGFVGPGSVVVSTRAPIGYVAIAGHQLAFNQGCKGLQLEGVDSAFLMHYLWASRERLQALGSGSTFTELGNEQLLSFELPLPPPDVQRRVAAFLDDQVTRIDNIIHARREQMQFLRDVWHAGLVEAVTHRGAGEENDAKGTPWEDCPWPVVELGRIAVKMRRPVEGRSEVITAFRDGLVAPRSARREDGFTFSDLEQGYQGVHQGDLVFHGLDGFAGALGVSTSDGRCSPVYHVIQAPDDDARYLAYALRVAAETGVLAVAVPSTRQRAVDFRNWQTLASVRLPRPPLAEQSAIGRQLDSLKEQLAEQTSVLTAMIKLLQELRQSLITSAVSGEFDVATADGTGVRV